ncbi:unnamed protein product, partial [Callosobruchus maculatus]
MVNSIQRDTGNTSHNEKEKGFLLEDIIKTKDYTIHIQEHLIKELQEKNSYLQRKLEKLEKTSHISKSFADIV